MDLPSYIVEEIDKYAKENKLTKVKKDKLLKAAKELYEKSIVADYEPVGILAAHSMAEPATQMVLRTKHYSGAAEVSLGSGIEIITSLVDARSKVKYPMMHVYLKGEYAKNEQKAKSAMFDLIFTSLGDVSKIIENLEEKKIYIELSPELLDEKGLDASLVEDVLKKQYKKKIKSNGGNSFIIDFKDQALQTIRRHFLKLKSLAVKGLPGIEDAILMNENGEYYIVTKGTNLKAVFEKDFVDMRRSYTNDVMETMKVLGIEAARQLLFNELVKVYKDNGIEIDLRHLSLLADAMCFDGSIKGVVRSGIVSSKESPLARASFEQTEKVLFEAAFNEEEEKFKGIIENILAGLPICVGVGRVDLIMKINKGGKSGNNKANK